MTTIPIVFVAVPDPVEGGLVDGLAHPGGNITGYAFVDVSPKRLQLFKGPFPPSRTWHYSLTQIIRRLPGVPSTKFKRRAVRWVSQFSRSKCRVHKALSAPSRKFPAGVVTVFDAMFFNERAHIAEVAVAHGLPVMTTTEPYVKAGLLMSYGPNPIDLYRRAGVCVDKILKGARPADLPVEQPTTLELVINLTTAKAIGLEIPPTLLARADEVIE